MRDAPDLRTSATLLGRLRHQPTDQAAWSEFVDRYGEKIYGWCRRWHLQDADAMDVTQAVLTSLCIKMRTFTYDPGLSFRGWLRTLTHHTWSDLVTSRRFVHAGRNSGENPGLLESLEARDDLIARLNEQFDQVLLEEATARVRLRVEPHTWEAFRLTALEGMAGAEVGERLRMKVATVFKAKSKVQRMLREEIARLEGADPAASSS
jgi:RNA polymerase sigma factor (sigma-70 family)